MAKTLIFTDTHITDPGDQIIGLDPAGRFRAALRHALEQHRDADRMVIMGDLTHHGRTSQYAQLAKLLYTVPLELHLTLGNHDTRAGFHEVFGPEGAEQDRFIQSSWVDGNDLYVLLDTLDEDGRAPQHGGWMCTARLDWLEDQIAIAKPTRIVAMMHHPPFETGFPGMDRIKLVNGDTLYAILKKPGVPVHMIAGHIHRTISGQANGIPFTTLKSPCHQMPMELEDTSTALSIDEPGAYGVLLTTDSSVVVHTEDVFDKPQIVNRDAASA